MSEQWALIIGGAAMVFVALSSFGCFVRLLILVLLTLACYWLYLHVGGEPIVFA